MGMVQGGCNLTIWEVCNCRRKTQRQANRADSRYAYSLARLSIDGIYRADESTERTLELVTQKPLRMRLCFVANEKTESSLSSSGHEPLNTSLTTRTSL